LEELLTHCGNLLLGDYPFLLSVALGGVLGGVGHCSVMCAPLTAAHMLALNARQAPQWIMAFYHAGRLSSYMVLGVMATVAVAWLFNHGLTVVSRQMMLAAGGLFVASALFPAKTHHCCPRQLKTLHRGISLLPGLKLQYYLRGALMGFMPCGLLWSALFVASTLPVPKAMAVMLTFGLATIPMLQLVGAGVLSLGRRYPQVSARAGKLVMVANGVFLCGIGLNLVHVN